MRLCGFTTAPKRNNEPRKVFAKCCFFPDRQAPQFRGSAPFVEILTSYFPAQN
jgi:hypothetical protein